MILNLIGYNADLQRFADIHGDSIETEDIQDLSKEFYTICPVTAVTGINQASTPDEAFDYLDYLATETLEASFREAPTLSRVTKRVIEILFYAKYSFACGWFDDWEVVESDLFDYLDNIEQKNYIPISEAFPYLTEQGKLIEAMGLARRRAEALIWDDIKGAKIGVVEKFRVIQAFRDEYEPNISDSEAFGGEWFAFESFLKCETWAELLEDFADWVNTLVFVEYAPNGELIEGRTEPQEYIYLIWEGL